MTITLALIGTALIVLLPALLPPRRRARAFASARSGMRSGPGAERGEIRDLLGVVAVHPGEDAQ